MTKAEIKAAEALKKMCKRAGVSYLQFLRDSLEMTEESAFDLTRAEEHYCRMEGISPADFFERKQG